MTTVRRHLFIRGRVQGVFFRESMREEAERLGVNGRVRNLSDGRVEALLEGPPTAVRDLETWARHGPKAARVEAVEATDETPVGERTFRVLR